MRILHQAWAFLFNYFWAPCDWCGESFGGHERGWTPREANWPGSMLLCPECTPYAPLILWWVQP